MAGPKSVSVVLIGRFTTFAGSTQFRTLPINVTPFDKAELFIWRGPMASGGTFDCQLEVSNDQQTWSQVTASDPGANSEAPIDLTLSDTWLRAVIDLGGIANPVVTCHLTGTLYRRRE